MGHDAGHDDASSDFDQSVPAVAEMTVHNVADTEFAQAMSVHHQGAIEMAGLAMTQASSCEVRSLAVRISAAQGPEIDTIGQARRAGGRPAHNGRDGHHGA